MSKKSLYCFEDLSELHQSKLIRSRMKEIISLWCWDIEVVESRINNEATAMKIKNFELDTDFHFVDDRLFKISFNGQLQLIDVVESIYDNDDRYYSMHKECLTVVSLSQRNKINVDFSINKSIVECNVDILNADASLSKKEQQHINNFIDHATLMLDIWRSSVIKKWREYYLEVFRKNNFKEIIRDDLINLGNVFLKNGDLATTINGVKNGKENCNN